MVKRVHNVGGCLCTLYTAWVVFFGLEFCTATNAWADQPAQPSMAPAPTIATTPLSGVPTQPPISNEPAAIFTVVANADDRFGRRVLAELSSLGFLAVRVDPGDGATSRLTLETAARQTGALAAIRAVPSGLGVEVWIADRVTGKTVLREIQLDRDAIDPEAALAIRAVELLRASLLEASLPVPPRGEVIAPAIVRNTFSVVYAAPFPVQPIVQRIVAPPLRPPKWRVSVGAGVIGGPSGVDPMATLDVGMSWLPFERFGFILDAQLPLSRPRLEGKPGSADVAVFLAGGGIRIVFTSPESRWAPSLDTGLYAVSVGARGSANQGYTAHDVEVWTAAPFVRAGFAFAAHPMLRLRADVLLSVTLQTVSLELSGEPTATFGQPIFGLSAGVDFGWF